jgi:signal peptide peptidase SppA
LHIPVVVSFGNTAASGGYYIAAKSDRIFASPKSLTGSIGVFGLRLDLTGFAKQFGVTSGTIAIGELSGIINPFNKMSRKMQTTFDNTIDRYYDQFKSVVSEGRRLDDKQVESVAQGRVWTGEQAMKNGLVDELGGGLFRALAYAERKFTSGDAEIVAWPKKRSFFERLRALSEDDDPRRIFALLKQWMTVSERSPAVHTDQNINTIAPFFNALLQRFSAGAQPILSGVYLCADENAAIECLVEQNLHQIDHDEADTYLA